METLTNSRAKALRRCPRLHYYSYELGRRPIKKGVALSFGTLFHNGLEAWWLAWLGGGSGIEPVMNGYDAIAAGKSDELDPIHDIRAEELLRGYDLRWRDEMKRYVVIAVESKFEAPVLNPASGHKSRTFRLSGKIDALVHDLGTDEHLLVEHKTTSLDLSPGSDYWLRLRMDGQVSQYVDGLRASLGIEVSRCLYDVARRPQLQQKLATLKESRKYTKGKGCKECGGKAGQRGEGEVFNEEDADPEMWPCAACDGTGWTEPPRLYSGQREHDEPLDEYRLRLRAHIAEYPNAYYARGDVVRLDEELDEYRSDIWQLALMLRARQRAGADMGERAWPRNPDACEQFGRRCEYWPVCTGAASIDDEHLFQTVNPHEELTDAPDTAAPSGE
jgi:hypothetical protein